MARINSPAINNRKTHEGATAAMINPAQELRRSVMANMLWEGEFYEDGKTNAARIAELVKHVQPEDVAAIAVEARERMKLRHIPLLLVRELARGSKTAKLLVADTLAKVIQRPDELAEFMAIYWKDKKQPLSAQVKKGLAAAFGKFNEYSLAKYNRDNAVKLRDVLFLCHAKPKDAEQTELWKKLVDGTLATPDTWEVELSGKAGEDKKGSWERLLRDKKLGALALLRNLRNMQQANVSLEMIREGLRDVKVDRVLPFRFVSAATHNPKLEPELEKAMSKCLSSQEKIPGKTVLVIDVSGSMGGQIGGKSELQRIDAAAALAMLVREVCEEVAVYCTAGNDSSRIHQTALIPARSGFALRDLVRKSSSNLGGGGIFLKQCMDFVHAAEISADRTIVFTDEQDCDLKCNPETADAFGKQNYLINVASFKNGIGYGKWTHIDGFSEAVIDYIRENEKVLDNLQ